MVDTNWANDESPWRVRSGLHYRALVDGGMLYDERDAMVHHLNATAALVWEGCQRGESTRQLVDALCALYDADAAKVREDIGEVLDEFVENGLLI